MRFLLFIARVACLCNVFFVICLAIRFSEISISQALAGFVIIMGWILSVIFNGAFMIYFLLLVIQKRRTGIHWALLTFNMLCLPLQIAFIFLFKR